VRAEAEILLAQNGSTVPPAKYAGTEFDLFSIVDSCRTIRLVTMPDGAYWVVPNQSEAGMPFKGRSLVLTKSQAACLIALRNGKVSKPEIAIQAKLALIRTATALGTLARLGLARQDQAKRWHTTARGKTCRFKTVPDRLRRNSRIPGSGGRRLLKLLDRPMRGNEIVEKLGVSHQRVRQLVIKLHAQGRVTFGDPENPFWIIRRADDRTPLLSRDEEHVLSAIPREYVTNVTKIRLAARMPENKVQKILERLIASRFVDEFEGLQGNRVYRLTEAGKDHPQRDESARRAAVPRLPVESDRVRKVLSTILDSGALRIRDVTDVLRIPRESINALMQYLKRKHLVKKTGPGFDAPYSLTDEGRAALAEMARRLAA
jgi:predicted transcriptional regulator